MAEALLGFGGNVGAVRETLHHAVERLCDGQDIRLLARSSDYKTPPWGIEDQPAFVNLCIAVETALAPLALLQQALATERIFGRDRRTEQRWGPRAIDIDLLAYGGVVLETAELVLPHPRLLERAFVLVPLAEIRPDLSARGRRVREALKDLDTAGIERLPPLHGKLGD